MVLLVWKYVYVSIAYIPLCLWVHSHKITKKELWHKHNLFCFYTELFFWFVWMGGIELSQILHILQYGAET